MVPSEEAPMNRFELVRLAMLRAGQLIRGCTPRVEPGLKATTTARHEVMAGKVGPVPPDSPV